MLPRKQGLAFCNKLFLSACLSLPWFTWDAVQLHSHEFFIFSRVWYCKKKKKKDSSWDLPFISGVSSTEPVCCFRLLIFIIRCCHSGERAVAQEGCWGCYTTAGACSGFEKQSELWLKLREWGRQSCALYCLQQPCNLFVTCPCFPTDEQRKVIIRNNSALGNQAWLLLGISDF